jgi:hypothetical protein
VTADAKEILHESGHREKPLRVLGGCEPAHQSLALARRLMRDLRSDVFVRLRAVHHGRHHGKEPRGRLAITPGLDEDVDEVTILVNRSPEIPTSALDVHKQLIEIPGVAQAPTRSP